MSSFAKDEAPRDVSALYRPLSAEPSSPARHSDDQVAKPLIDPQQLAQATLTVSSRYDERDLSLYALGIGLGQDALNERELAYIDERRVDFQAFPSYAMVPMMSIVMSQSRKGITPLLGMNFGLDRLLHGAQYMRLQRPLPPRATLTHHFSLKQLLDKDPHAVVTLAISSRDEQGEELIYNELTAFVMGGGGFGGVRGVKTAVDTPPAGRPDAVIEEVIADNQALLYRLSGDWNPLHVNPAFALEFGFKRPILHGLCTLGFCCRHVVKAFAHNDGRRLKSVRVRFSASVFPGETLVTQMWSETTTRIVFEARVKERDMTVITQAVIELFE